MVRFRWLLLLGGWLLAIFPAVALSLLLMPIIRSMQQWDSVPWSFAIYRAEYAFIAVGAVCFLLGFRAIWQHNKLVARISATLLLALALVIILGASAKMTAEAMFNEPTVVHRTLIGEQVDPASDTAIYVWVHMNGQLAGYPVDLVAHHHKIQDTVGGIPVLVTYCTMCHTARVFSPIIGGAHERFRLVGANHFNAMFEDVTTKSWWYQATGECVAGERKGMTLLDLPFMQGTYAEARAMYPAAQASRFDTDTATGQRYRWAHGYAARHGDTTQDLAMGSLVVGIERDGHARAYPLRALLRASAQRTVLVDTFRSAPIYIKLPHAWNDAVIVTTDTTATAQPLNAYQEYWHSWQHFHPTTTVWKP